MSGPASNLHPATGEGVASGGGQKRIYRCSAPPGRLMTRSIRLRRTRVRSAGAPPAVRHAQGGCMNGRSGFRIVLLALLALASVAAWSCDAGPDAGASARAESGQAVHAAAVDSRDAHAQRYLYWEASAPGATLNLFLPTSGSKAIIELESIWQQLEFFHDFTDQEQEAMLIGSLDDIARGPELFQNMMDAWRAGADAELDSLLNNDAFRNDAAAQRLYRVLIVDRNAAMTDKLAALLKRGGTYFVVVGAAHLVGDQGIVSQLRERGYRIGRL